VVRFERRFASVNGVSVFCFGPHQGESVPDVWGDDPVYLKELMDSGDLSPEEVELVQSQKRRFMAPPLDDRPDPPQGGRGPVVIDMEYGADGCYHAASVRETRGPGIQFAANPGLTPEEVLAFVFGGGAG
jgi:hypothetical protein